MLRTYRALLNKNRLQWVEENPGPLAETAEVFVTILEKEATTAKTTAGSLVDFFKKSPLYNSEIELKRDRDFGREVRFSDLAPNF